jgi:glycine/D-amino acid oxidase-like deaminating enzyme
MSGPDLFERGWSSEPYWWREAPLEPERHTRLPARVDVAIVGAGFTGLSAALELSRAGRAVLVLDGLAPGEGASSRNGGMVGSGHRLPYDELARLYGEARAADILREGLSAFAFTTGLIEREGIDCQFQRTGRFRAAWRAADYEDIARDVEAQKRVLGLDADMGPRAEQDREVATERYHGGCVYHAHGGLHPALFHQGLLGRARAAGAQVQGHTRVQAIEREAEGFRLRTTRGKLRARDVIIATNGYTDRAASSLRCRLASIPSFIIATERLGENRVRSLIPGGRMIVESRSAHCYYRPSPDGERILFGARAALHPVSPERAAGRLYAYLLDLFPSLEGVRLQHSWSGYVAFTRHWLPSLGVRDGIHYAAGYCGSGVAMAPYLGYRIAHRLLGTAEGRTALDDLPFRPWPLAFTMPLLMPAATLWHRLKDWRERA